MKSNHYQFDIQTITNDIASNAAKFRDKKILLVGANGFLGKYFVKTFEQLIKKNKFNIYVDCYDNHISSKKKEYLSLSNTKNIRFNTADINNVKISKKYNYII